MREHYDNLVGSVPPHWVLTPDEMARLREFLRAMHRARRVMGERFRLGKWIRAYREGRV